MDNEIDLDLKIPLGMHARLVELAEARGCSVDALIAQAVSDYVGWFLK